jgi:hypothetical protein
VARAITAAGAAVVALPLLLILLVSAAQPPRAPGDSASGAVTAQVADALGGAPTTMARARIPAP